MVRRTTTKRRYSDDDRANALAALAANGGNVHRTARELGISDNTLRHWAKGERHPEAAKMGEQKKASLADAFEEVAWKLVPLIPKAAKIAARRGQVGPLATAAAIATDKMRLLREQATDITRTEDGATKDDLDKRTADAEARLAESSRRLAEVQGSAVAPREPH